MIDPLDPSLSQQPQADPQPEPDVPDPAAALPADQGVDAATDAAPQPRGREETDEAWRLRFLEENAHLAPSPLVRPPAPPPMPWDGPSSSWRAPEHLSMPHPRGGYMAMALLSRTMDDLDEVTGSKRAATYDEVDQYFGHALITEGLVPRTATPEEAIRWWKGGGYKVLGRQAATTGQELHETSLDEPASSADGGGYTVNLSELDEPESASSPETHEISPVAMSSPQIEQSERDFLGTDPMSQAHPGSVTGKKQSAPDKDAGRANGKLKERPPAPPGTNLSTYDLGFGPGHGVNGDYRTTPQERAWLREPKSTHPEIPYPDGKPGSQGSSSKGRRKIREDVGYLYTLPEVKALLDLISQTEGSARYGYRTSHDLDPPLGDLDRFHGTAPKGRYQIKLKTWRDYGQALWSSENFSEVSQDLVAITLLRDRGAIRDLLAGNLSGALTKAAGLFASIPLSLENDSSAYLYGGAPAKNKPSTGARLQPTPIHFKDLPDLFVQRLNARRKEFKEAEQAWKKDKKLPKAFISPLRWQSFGLGEL